MNPNKQNQFPIVLLNRQDTFDALKQRGAVMAIVHFEGGGDQGDITAITLYDADNNEVGTVSRSENYPRIIYGQGKFQMFWDKAPTADDILWMSLAEPIDNKYGSFAGNYSVSGVVEYDTRDETVILRGTETVEEDFSEDL